MLSFWSGKDILLMFGDIEVMLINVKRQKYKVLNNKYLPYVMKHGIVETDGSIKGTSPAERFKAGSIILNNKDILTRWITGRTLLLSKSNMEKLYRSIGVEEMDDVSNKFEMAIACRAVSLLDKYWLKYADEKVCWSDVNIRDNHLKEIFVNEILPENPTLQGTIGTPDRANKGIYAKVWRREKGGLYLYKLDGKDGNESRKEIIVSNILDKCNVNHVYYASAEIDGKSTSKCKCIADDKYSIVTAYDYAIYCDYANLNFEEEVLRIDADGYYKMHIVDYLISNSDRHSLNWGFFMDNDTMQLKSLHPLFDHNCAFNSGLMSDEDKEKDCYRCTGRAWGNDAKEAIKHVDFCFTALPIRSDFITDEQYDSFMKRIEELGIRTILEKNAFLSAVIKMGN